MLFKSTILESGSGSFGGVTVSHNRGGLYMRGRKIPTNPNTPQQQAVRSAAAQLASLWGNTLTPLQRATWDLYADNVHLPNPLGDSRNVGGLGMYVRTNVPRIQASIVGIPRIDDAPIIFDLGSLTEPTIGVATAAANTISVAYDNADQWAIEDGGALLIYTSRAQNPSVNYFKGPYQLAAVVEGDTAVPPTSPEVVTAAFPFEVDQRVFIYARATTADGRLSTPFRGFCLGA